MLIQYCEPAEDQIKSKLNVYNTDSFKRKHKYILDKILIKIFIHFAESLYIHRCINVNKITVLEKVLYLHKMPCLT